MEKREGQKKMEHIKGRRPHSDEGEKEGNFTLKKEGKARFRGLQEQTARNKSTKEGDERTKGTPTGQKQEKVQPRRRKGKLRGQQVNHVTSSS